MKKLLLSVLVAFVASFTMAQSPTYLGTSTNQVRVRNTFRIMGASTLNGSATGKVLTTNAAGDVILVSGGGYTLVPATGSTLGGVIVGTGLSVTGGGTLSATGFPSGNATQYWRGDNTWQGLATGALSDFPVQTGQSGKVLGTNGSTLSWVTNSGSGGLPDAYTTITDGSITAAASGASPIKFRSANNRIDVAVGSNDPTHGDNLLITFNEANVTLAQSQITGLVAALSGKEPTITSGTTLQYIRGNKTLATLNTTAVPEGSNLYYTDARAQALGNSLYSLLAHNHTLDALSNVNTTGKHTGDVLSWNGSVWTWVTPSAGGISSVTLSGDVTGGPGASFATTIANDAVTNAKAANMPASTIKGNDTGGAADPKDLTVSEARALLGVNNTTNTSDANKPVSTAQQSALDLKLNITNGSPLGVFDASGASNVKLPRVTDAVLQRDTLSFFNFGAGSAITGDTLWVTTSTIAGSFYNTGTDTLVLTNLNFVLQGSSPTVTVTLQYGTSLNTGGTSIVTGGTVVTNTTTGQNVTSFNNAKIPPGNHVWCKLGGIVLGSKPTYFRVTGSGTKSRKG